MRHSLLRQFWKCLLLIAASCIILLAIVLNIARAATPLLDQKKTFFEELVSQALHRPVRIGRIVGWWHGFEPEIQLSNVVVKTQHSDRPILKVHRLSISINVWKSLWQWQLLPGHVAISGVKFAIYQAPSGELMMSQVHAATTQKKSDATKIKDVLIWVLTQTNMTINHVDILWHGLNNFVLPIKNLRIKVKNNGEVHEAAAVAGLAQAVPTTLKVIFKFNRASLQKKQLDGDLYVHIRNLLLAQWWKNKVLRNYLKGFNVNEGTINLRAWTHWQNDQLQTMAAQLAAQHVKVKLPPHWHGSVLQHIDLNQGSGNFFWKRYHNGWGIAADQLRVTVNGQHWQENRIGYRTIHTHHDASEKHIVYAGSVHLASLRNALQWIPQIPKTVHEAVAKIQPKGTLSDLALAWWSRSGLHHAHALPAVIISTRFQHLSLNHWHQIPCVKNLSGSLYYAPHAGRLHIHSKHALINIPKVFSRAFDMKRIDVDAHWKQQAGNLQVTVSHFLTLTRALDMVGAFHLTHSQTGANRIALIAGFRLKDAKQLGFYLPHGLLSDHVIEWLSRAFPQGSAQHGAVLLQGPLKDFPFNQHNGHFELYTKLKHVMMDYMPHWPLLKNLSGTFHIIGHKMIATGDRGAIGGNPIDHVSAIIPNFNKIVLLLNAFSSTDLKTGVQFLSHTPLEVGKQLAELHLQGPVNIHLQMKIPFYGHQQHSVIQGHLHILHGQLHLPNWHINVDNIRGNLNFTGANLNSKQLLATILGKPASITVNTLLSPQHQNIIQAQIGGHLNVAHLQKQLELPILHNAQGDLAYRALLSINDQPKHTQIDFNLVSSLQGVTIQGLPSVFDKTKVMPKWFRLELRFKPDKSLQLRVGYAHQVSAAFTFNALANGFKMHSGNVFLGDQSARWPAQPGFKIHGLVNHLNWQDWRTFLQKYLSSNKKQAGAMQVMGVPFRGLDLAIKHLKIFHDSLKNVALKLTPGKQGWRLYVKSNAIDGALTIPDKQGATWYGRFEKINLPKMKAKSAASIDPHAIPPLNLYCKDFRYNNKQFGQVYLITKPAPSGLNIVKLSATSPNTSVTLTGHWRYHNKQSQTLLTGIMYTKDLGKLLGKWGYSKFLAEGSGGLGFSLLWPNAPYSFQLKGLNGNLNLKLRNGRFTDLGDKATAELGLGRLLNFLSLRSIARSLALHFSDITTKGFHFDKFTGLFQIRHGWIKTENAEINGPVAEVKLHGGVGFEKKKYDLYLTVLPHLTSSLPTIVGLAGGPIAGAIAWIVNKIIGPQISKAVGFTIQISGPLKKPHIEKLSEHPLVRLPMPIEERQYH